MRHAAAVFVLILLLISVVPMLGGNEGNVTAASLDSWVRVFHLHDGSTQAAGEYDWMNSSGPYNPTYTDYDLDGLPGITIKKNVPPQRWHHWFLVPQVGENMTLTGEVSAYVWAKSRNNISSSMITGILFDMPPGQYGDPTAWAEIGRVTIPLSGPVYSEFQLYNLTVPVEYTIAAGHYLVLTVQRGDSLNDWLLVWYDTTYYDSYVVLRTTTFVRVDSVFTKDIDGLPRAVFSDQENATVESNVSNLFGAYEITGAEASVAYASNGSLKDGPEPMSLLETDPSIPAYWKRFELRLDQLPKGEYIVNVSGFDPQGTPSWTTCPITIVSVDHFAVDGPPYATAGSNFSVNVTAKDQFNATVVDWVGSVDLVAMRLDMINAGNGSLGVTSIAFNGTEFGVVMLNNESYSYGDETILIKASSGSRVGWSQPIDVHSGPVVIIDLGNATVNATAGVGVPFTAIGLDTLNNTNTSWTPYWSTTGDVGYLVGSGTQITFMPTKAGIGLLSCTNNLTGASSTVLINVTSGLLDHIVIDAFPQLTLEEGQSRLLHAVGYDVNGNVVDLKDAWWTTNASGNITALDEGRSALFIAGLIPGPGTILVHNKEGNVVGSLPVIVTTSAHGPWFGNILPQNAYEDAGSWELSLVGIWNHENGTQELLWWAEGVDTSLYYVAHDPLANSVVMFYTQPNQFGDDTFVLWAVDKVGHRAKTTISVSIIAVNDPPEFIHEPPTQLYVKFEMVYVFDYSYYVFDIDNEKASLTLSSASGNLDFEGLNAAFNFPKKSGDESYFEFVTLTLSDGAASADLKIVVWVTSDTPPSLNSSLPPIDIMEGDMNFYAFDLDSYFYDADGDALYYSRGFDNVVVTINYSTHEVFVSAPGEWAGVEEGVISATDPTGAMKVSTFRVTVTAVNDPPRLLKAIGDVYVKYNKTYLLYLSPLILDPDNSMDTLDFIVAPPYDEFVRHNLSITGAHRLELTFPSTLNGSSWPYTASVKLTVKDPDNASIQCTFKVMVTGNEPPMIAIPNPDQLYYSFKEDEYLNGSLRLYNLFNDPDDSILDFQIYGQRNIRAAIFSGGIVNLSAPVNWSGTELLNISAKDPHNGWAFLQAYITVTPVNDAPVISKIPNIINKGSAFRTAHYFIAQYVYDSDNPFAELKFTTTPAGNAFVIGRDLYISLPENVNVMTVTIQADDGDLVSNVVTFKVGVEKTIAEKLGWPYSFPLVLLAAGIAAYFGASRIPRPYALENLFLIHNDGRLVAHVTKEENTNLDKDVVSAMFTAVQEFVRDSFQKGEVGLKKLEIGDKNVVIEKGHSVYLAMIYSGWPTKDVFGMLPMLVRDVEERYKQKIATWNGTMKTVKGVDKMLQDFMAGTYEPGTWHEEEEMAEQEWVDILSKEA